MFPCRICGYTTLSWRDAPCFCESNVALVSFHDFIAACVSGDHPWTVKHRYATAKAYREHILVNLNALKLKVDGYRSHSDTPIHIIHLDAENKSVGYGVEMVGAYVKASQFGKSWSLI